MFYIILFLILSLLLISLLIIYVTINTYFLKFNINKHPQLKELIEKKLYSIANENKLKIFIVSFEELNKNETNIEHRAVGKYFYTQDEELLESCNKILIEIKDFEEIYGSINVYRKATNKNEINLKNFYYPRIELAKPKEDAFSTTYFYKTFAHELGHHISITKDKDNSEEAANKIAKEIINELPNYFKLIYWYVYKEISFFTEIKYTLEFFKYYLNKKLTFFNIKNII